MAESNIEKLRKLVEVELRSAKLSYAGAMVARAKFISGASHFLALTCIEKLVEKFDEDSAMSMIAARDFFGDFWSEIEINAREEADYCTREAIAWSGAARAFRIISPETKALVGALQDPIKTPTNEEFLAKLRELKAIFPEHPGMIKIWCQTFEEKFGSPLY